MKKADYHAPFYCHICKQYFQAGFDGKVFQPCEHFEKKEQELKSNEE